MHMHTLAAGATKRTHQAAAYSDEDVRIRAGFCMHRTKTHGDLGPGQRSTFRDLLPNGAHRLTCQSYVTRWVL